MARVLTRVYADLVEQLELDSDHVVTIDRLVSITRQLGLDGDPRRIAYELQRAGWLGTLRTRHAWEFLPAARGGPFSSGDRFIEFRAQREIRPEWPAALAMESAASLLGLAQRLPDKEVLALPDNAVFPKALNPDWRYVRVALPEEAMTPIDGMPSWDREGLIVGISMRPSGYRDIAGLGQWLPELKNGVDAKKIIRLLATTGAAARQRTAYLMRAAGDHEGARQVIDTYPPAEPAWFGPRKPGGRFDPLTQVNDTSLHRYLRVGTIS